MVSTILASRKIRDRDWVRQSFLIGGVDNNGNRTSNLSEVDVRNRSFSSASFKFTDTTPGGNIAINPPPQFSRNTDIRAKGLIKNSSGLGVYYNEAIDDNSRLVSIRLGVPDFNSLHTFWTGFYNAEFGTLARTGRPAGFAFKIGQVIGFIVPFLSLPLLLLNITGNIYRFLTQSPSSKFYYLRPTMHLYWTSVNTILNTIAVNKGVIPRVFNDDQETKKKIDNTYLFTKEDYKKFSQQLPDIFLDEGGISAYAIATKAMRTSLSVQKSFKKMIENQGDNVDIRKILDRIKDDGVPSDNSAYKGSYIEYISGWLKSESSVSADAKLDDARNGAPVTEGESVSWRDHLVSALNDGAEFATFRVDADGSVGESFSNQVGQPEVASKFNSTSSSTRMTKFNFSGMNIGDGALASAIEGLGNGVRDFAMGLADGIGASGLASLAGGAFVDIPNTWTGSTASLPRMNYTMSLTSPYGNKLSQMFNIYLPLSMILAAALPLSTGKSSYTSPFILELYDKGRAQTRLGIIDSLSITRGTSNLPFDNNGNAMAIDVSFSVIDLSTIVHMPIAKGFSLSSPISSTINNVLGDDSTFSDYMAVLGGLSLQEQIYVMDRLKIALTRQMASMRTWASSANFAVWFNGTLPGKFLSIWQAGITNR